MTVDYHIQSIRSALVREFVGGVPADDSYLMQQAVSALMQEHGLSEEEVILACRERFPQ